MNEKASSTAADKWKRQQTRMQSVGVAWQASSINGGAACTSMHGLHRREHAGGEPQVAALTGAKRGPKRVVQWDAPDCDGAHHPEHQQEAENKPVQLLYRSERTAERKGHQLCAHHPQHQQEAQDEPVQLLHR